VECIYDERIRALRAITPDRWAEMSPAERDAAVRAYAGILGITETPETMVGLSGIIDAVLTSGNARVDSEGQPDLWTLGRAADLYFETEGVPL
jgi:hypothetical protein